MSLPATDVRGVNAVAPARHGTRAAALVWGRVLVVVTVLILAAGIRMVDLTAVGYNSDEAVYAGQAAALAEVPVLRALFPVFRAHPLLYQFVLSVVYRFGFSDEAGRLVSVAVGVLTVLLTYALGRRLYGHRAGVYGAALLAVMPYHVVVTRQVLLDGPMTLFATLALWALASFAASGRARWLYATAAAIGLTFLAKEIGFIMVGAVYAFLALSPRLAVRLRDLLLSLVTLVLVMLPYPLSVMLASPRSGGTTRQYLVWQLFRRPNHTWDFYATVVPSAIGWVVLAAAALGLLAFPRANGWRQRLLLAWVLVPVVFFTVWPTKGFQYLLPIAPALAVLAAGTLAQWPRRTVRLLRWRFPQHALGAVLAMVMVATLALSTWHSLHPGAGGTLLAGSGGVPGGRETGHWIAANVPEGATFMTIGPSMANLVKFYGHREALGLSVSPNPLHRNPSYQPIVNPDYQIRIGELQYVVWDAYSASRSTFFSDGVLRYARRYNGRVVHVETLPVTGRDGAVNDQPVIVVYEVHP